MNKLVSLLLAAILCLGGAACGKKKKAKSGAGEKRKAAAQAEAVKQYQSLVRKYPDSEYAPQAKERLDALAPQKKK